MTHLLVNPSSPRGATLRVPGDKSISHRALMLAAIAEGESRIDNFLNGADCLATSAALRALGVRIVEQDATTVRVHGVGLDGLQRPVRPLDLGNSGTGMRLFAGLLAGQAFDSVLTGDASLSRRPMGRVIEPLSRMGASIDSREGLPPLAVHGRQRLRRIDYSLPVASAQVKSAILLAALYADGVCEVSEPTTTRDHTERMLECMGVALEYGRGRIQLRGRPLPQARDFEVAGELSSAAFILLAVLLASVCEALIESVGVNPTRTGVLEILSRMGADLRIENRRLAGREPVADIRVTSSRLHGIDVDPSLVSLAIDEFPVLFVAAACARGTTRFSGIGELRVKESDRIGAMANGLRRLGIEVEEQPDGALVHGGEFAGGIVDSYDDHRIAMSLAVAGTAAAGPVTIRNTDNIETSFPGFAACLRMLGADITDLEAVPA
jgi:3-phosphoshikimate 1-carboxyvinyltransferase